MNTFSTRKIICGFFLLLVGVGITYVKGDIPPNLMSFMQVLYGAFVLGNAAEHYTTMKTVSQDVDKDKDSSGAATS